MAIDKPEFYLTDDDLVKDFNSQKMSVKEIADKYSMPLYKIKSRIKFLQNKKIIGYKDRSGRIISPPGSVSGRSQKPEKENIKEKDKSLAEVIEEKIKIGGTDKTNHSFSENLESFINVAKKQECISIQHKEMLIEVLHKLIC